VIWNPLGFRVVDALPTGAKMNNDILLQILVRDLQRKMFPAGRNPPAKRLTIHLDKRSIHGGRENEAYINERDMVWFQDHLYSANLAPSDFCLFSTIKEN
jgi:hypothetical protein